jgi:DNA-binding CsgD family transcriptional regulator
LVRVLTAMVRMGAIDESAPLVKLAHTEAMRDGRELDAVRLRLLYAEISVVRGRLEQASGALAEVIDATPATSPWNKLAKIGRSGLLMLRAATDEEIDPTTEVDIDEWRALGPLDDTYAATLAGRLNLMRQQWQSALDDFAHAELLARARGIENPALTSWRTGRVEALVGIGEGEAAAALATHNLELSRAFGAPTAVARGLRTLACTLPDTERIGPLETAVEMLDGRSNVMDRCCAMVDLGRAYRDAGDTASARMILREAADMAVRIGAASLIDVATEELHATGARPRRLQTRGFDSLTPAERRVALLAAEGKTNGSIAASLYISMKTVESHLARTYRKLGVKSRAELAGVFGLQHPVDDSAAASGLSGTE